MNNTNHTFVNLQVDEYTNENNTVYLANSKQELRLLADGYVVINETKTAVGQILQNPRNGVYTVYVYTDAVENASACNYRDAMSHLVYTAFVVQQSVNND